MPSNITSMSKLSDNKRLYVKMRYLCRICLKEIIGQIKPLTWEANRNMVAAILPELDVSADNSPLALVCCTSCFELISNAFHFQESFNRLNQCVLLFPMIRQEEKVGLDEIREEPMTDEPSQSACKRWLSKFPTREEINMHLPLCLGIKKKLYNCKIIKTSVCKERITINEYRMQFTTRHARKPLSCIVCSKKFTEFLKLSFIIFSAFVLFRFLA